MSSQSLIHLVTVHPRFAEHILSGRKTMESRFTKTRRVPHGRVLSGERLYFKVVSGPVFATAISRAVQFHKDLSSKEVLTLGERHAEALAAPPDYFESKRDSRYATLVDLERVEPVDFGPRCNNTTPGTPRDGWRVLPASMDVYPGCLSQSLFDSFESPKGPARLNERHSSSSVD